MKFIIVESPTKARTITRFLGQEYEVASSYGHIRDLPKSKMGIDIENRFEPTYIVPAASKKTIKNLKEHLKKAGTVILATDEDREGEAIAWHLKEALGLGSKKGPKIERIVFHEITKHAITQALANPRDINMLLVHAQQARRLLDRLVGYELSPFLWKKVAKGLSAGRVQSVAVRLIVEREREINAFKPEEYWTIDAHLLKAPGKHKIIAHLSKIDGKPVDKLEIKDAAHAEKIAADLEGARYLVKHVDEKETRKKAPAPFTTSSLQQTANRWLGMSAKDTMRTAQQLYEGVEIKGEGSVGLITYMRTDSLNLSENFLADAASYLKDALGDIYALEKPRRFKTRQKGAQEAHEAIRPTEAGRDPETVKNSLTPKQYRLYKLIWQRAIASQMPDALIDSTAIDITAHDTPYQFRATGHITRFDGFLKVYPEKTSEIELPRVGIGEELELEKLARDQHYTKPPARYSDAGLVKALERFGIGRPSTYAPTIATIEARNYVRRDPDKRLAPTDISLVVTDLLVEHFPEIIDFEFTAKMENELDSVAEGEAEWHEVLSGFYGPFHSNLEAKYKQIKKEDVLPEEKTDVACDKCGEPMIIKTGRFGRFLACSAFPECRNVMSLDEESGLPKEKNEKEKELEEKYKDVTCPKCGAPMIIKTGRFGPFLACTSYPKCKSIKSIKENGSSTNIACPACGEGTIVAKRSRRGMFYACDRYPDCKTSFPSKPTGGKCPDCGALLIEARKGIKCSNKECGYKKE